MAPGSRVEIIWFSLDPKSTKTAQEQIEKMLAKGWVIAGSGGGGNQEVQGCFLKKSVSTGFVVMLYPEK